VNLTTSLCHPRHRKGNCVLLSTIVIRSIKKKLLLKYSPKHCIGHSCHLIVESYFLQQGHITFAILGLQAALYRRADSVLGQGATQQLTLLHEGMCYIAYSVSPVRGLRSPSFLWPYISERPKYKVAKAALNIALSKERVMFLNTVLRVQLRKYISS
jgi:hypothetical protein